MTASGTEPPLGNHYAFQSNGPLELKADYVVVGSGAGGAAAAVVLARAGRSVVVCEAGPWRDPPDYPMSCYGAMRDLWKDWGQLLAQGRSMIPIVQAACVGGTTVINSAIVVRTPGSVLREWADMGVGDMFNEQTMGEAQVQIEAELEVAAMRGDQLGRNNQTLLDALAARQMEGHATERNAARCMASSQCLQGCRNDVKQSTNVQWIPELIERGGAVVSCAPVHRVLFERHRAVGVRGRFRHPQPWQEPARGATFTVRARRAVLVAASATGSAPLLARSGVRQPALGRYWRGHPGAGVVGVYPDAIHSSRGATQGASSMQLAGDGIKLESLSLPLEMLAARLPGAGQSLMKRLEDAPRMAVWVAAIRAEAVGSVRRNLAGKPSVRYSPTPRDLTRLRHGVAELARLHFEAGATSVLPGVYGLPAEIGADQLRLLDEAPLDNRCWFWVLSHLFGGCIMGRDLNRSVVDPQLQVHGYRGLYVVDAACLPTTLGVNPQHTIMAVAWVAAQRMANQESP